MPQRTYQMETKGNEQKEQGMGGNEKEDCELNQFHYVKSKWKPWKILRTQGLLYEYNIRANVSSS